VSEETLIVLVTPKCDPSQTADVFSSISSLSELEGKKVVSYPSEAGSALECCTWSWQRDGQFL